MSNEPIIPASLERRLAQYAETAELYAQGLPNAEIARKLGVDIDRVRRWAKGEKPKRVHRYEPDLSPGKDLAYVAGFYLGDGKDAGEEHKVRFELSDREQLVHVGRLIAKILGREPKPLGRDGTFYTVDYDSVVLSTFLNQEVGVLAEHLKDFIPDFLRGFFDAEGYASAVISYALKRIYSVSVGIANTRLEYLNTIRSLLSTLGIFCKIRRTNKRGENMTIRGKTWIRRNDVYHLVIRRNDLVVRFREIVGFMNKAKAEKLQDIVELLPMTPSERYDWFTSHYRKQGHNWVKTRK